MHFFCSRALLIVCSLFCGAAFAARDYSFELHIVNENAVSNVCTDAESQDLSSRMIPTILSVLADPKYDLKPTQESDWKTYGSKPALNRKERDLQSGCTCNGYSCANFPYYCQTTCSGKCSRLLLRSSQRGLSDIEVLEIRSNTEGAMRGLLNKFANTSPYSKDCTKAIMGATIGSSLIII